jgi:hypothetical protein
LPIGVAINTMRPLAGAPSTEPLAVVILQR